MKTRLWLALPAVMLSAACVSVAPPASAGPTATAVGALPTSQPIITPAPVGTLAPGTLPPIATPQPVSTPAPTAPPTAAPTAAPPTTPPDDGSLLGADTPVFDDDMDDPSSGWALRFEDGMTVDYTDGGDNSLYMLIEKTDGDWIATTRALGGEVRVARVDAEVEISSDGRGAYGVECQDEDYDALGAALTTDGGYLLYRNDVMTGPTIIVRYDDPPLPGVGPGSMVTLSLECAVDGAGNAEIYFWANGELLLHQTEAAAELGLIRSVGLYTDAFSGSTMETNFWRVAVTADAEPSWAPEVEAIQARVPSDYADTCQPANTDGLRGVVAGLVCNGEGEDGAYIAVFFYQYEDSAAMEAGFDEYLDDYGPGEQDNDCTNGEPGSGTYTIGGEPAGEYLCYTDFGYPAIVWTAPPLNMVAVADSDGEDFAELWNWWASAGPTR